MLFFLFLGLSFFLPLYLRFVLLCWHFKATTLDGFPEVSRLNSLPIKVYAAFGADALATYTSSDKKYTAPPLETVDFGCCSGVINYRLWYWGSDLERAGWSISHNALFGLVSYNDFGCWSPRYYMWIVDHCTRGKERLCRWQPRYFLLVRNHPFQVQWKLSILRFGLAAQTPFFDKKFETPQPLCTVVSNILYIYIFIFMSMICIYRVSQYGIIPVCLINWYSNIC